MSVATKVTALAQVIGADIKALFVAVAGKASVSSAAPSSLAAQAASGTSADASRADHVHPYPSSLPDLKITGSAKLPGVTLFSTAMAGVSSADWTNVPLDSSGNTALVAGYVYTFRLNVTGTSSNTGASYQVYQTAASTWAIRLVANSGTDSNKPRLQVSGGVVQVTTNNSNAYNLQVTVETRYTGNVTLSHPSALGIDGVLSHDGDASTLTATARVIGAGAAPSAWASQNYGVELQGGAVISQSTGVMQLVQNAVLTTGGWVYKYNTYASIYSAYGGWHYWNTAPSGTSGSSITWSTPMALSYAGNLLIGSTSDNGSDRLQVNGTIYATSPANKDSSNKVSTTAWVNINALCWYDNSATDFNAMTTSGVSFTAASNGNPSGSAGGILLVKNVGSLITQQFHTLTANNFFMRSSTDGGVSWNAWKQAATTASPTFSGTTTTSSLKVNGLMVNLAGGVALYGPGSLPALSTTMVAGEITGNGNQNLGTDYGMLRLSAGGGAALSQKSAIDLIGYTDDSTGRQIVFYAGGVRVGSFKASGNLLIGTSTDNGTDKLQISGTLLSSGNRLQAVSAPSAPASGYTLEYGQTLAGRTLPAAIPSMGKFVVNDPARWRRKISVMNAQGGGTTWFYDTMAAPAAVGTATARTVTAGTMVGMAQRIGYVSAATVGSLSGLYATLGMYTLGTGTLGGFFYSTRFAFSDPAAVSGARAFVGLSSSVAAPTNVEPNTLTNCVGLAQLSTDATQLYIVYGGSAGQAAIGLGAGFPPMAATGITGGPIYELTLYSPSTTSGVVYYRVERLDTGTFVEGSVGPGTAGTTLPANTTLLAHRAWRTNNATALAVGIDIVSVYLETEQ
ncbi:fibronectin type III domain protein [Aquitalea magnusonii]|uniref:Fibronectin type III domain protein n=1 Tax=Aquitalea magnusonii TaxID=332411 RepID=A0A3G9GGD0_9NEIS|nr:pyocin knob domain-containing protein [Aquitalea magnusonii]BBF85689.1 fibronectin type III domain protein [Aquitalea magnusonii]